MKPKKKKKKPVSPAIREVRDLERKLRSSEHDLGVVKEDLSCARGFNARLQGRVIELEASLEGWTRAGAVAFLAATAAVAILVYLLTSR